MNRNLPVCQKCHRTRESSLAYHPDWDQPDQLVCDYCYYENHLDYLADTVNSLLRSNTITDRYRILKLLTHYDQQIERLSSRFLKQTHRNLYQQLIETTQSKQINAQSDSEEEPSQPKKKPITTVTPQSEPVYRYSCPSCDYHTDKTSSYQDHLKSKRHLKMFHNITVDRKARSDKGKKKTQLVPDELPEPNDPSTDDQTVDSFTSHYYQTESTTEFEPLTEDEPEYISSDESIEVSDEELPAESESESSELFSHDSELSAILQSSEDEPVLVQSLPKQIKLTELKPRYRLIIKADCRPTKPNFRISEAPAPVIDSPVIKPPPQPVDNSLPLKIIQQYPTKQIPDFSINDTLEFLSYKARDFSSPRYLNLRPDEKQMIDRLLASLLFHSTHPNHFKNIYQYIVKKGPANPVRDRLGQLFYELDQALTKQPKSKWKPIHPVIHRFTTYYLINGQPKKRQTRRR